METPNLSSSTTSIWNYDVFLSFRGEDTRLKFTDHLYHALCRVGINTFRDEEELRAGDEIRPALLKAIGGSRILIIVFSVSYASSSWCLDELVKIFKCEKEKKQVVFPIFYEVDPSEVRHQSGRFGDAMVKHEKRYRDNIQKVENWKSALRKAANVSGESYKKGMSESQFIEKIIMKILSILNIPLLHLPDQAVGLGSQRLQVVSLLSIKSNDPDVSMVGICGIGGVGKTTRKVYRYLKGFDGVEDCKTSKVVVKGEKADPVKVVERIQRKSHRQGELISPIPKPPPPVEEEEEEEKVDAEDKPKPEDKKEEPQVITVVLKVWMHCEACAMDIKKKILRVKGVESAEPDLKTSQVAVKGIFDPPKLADYVRKRTRKEAVILKQEPEKKKEGEEDKGKEPSKEEEEKKKKEKEEEEGDKEKTEGGEEEDDKEEKKEDEEDKGKEPSKEEEGEKKKEREEEGDKEKKEDGGSPLETTSTVVEVKRNEYQYYPQRNPPLEMMYYAYPPQIFSDENPNACTVM